MNYVLSYVLWIDDWGSEYSGYIIFCVLIMNKVGPKKSGKWLSWWSTHCAKSEELSLDPQHHVKAGCSSYNPVGGRGSRQADSWGSLTSPPTQTNELHVQWDTLIIEWKDKREIETGIGFGLCGWRKHLKLASGFHIHMCTKYMQKERWVQGCLSWHFLLNL